MFDEEMLREVQRRINERSYVWQDPFWPDFQWDRGAAREEGDKIIQSLHREARARDALPKKDREKALVEMMAAEAVKTSEIENEHYTIQDTRLAIENHMRGRPYEYGLSDPKAVGISRMMVEVGRECTRPLSRKNLCRWQSLIVDAAANESGRWRTHPVGVYAITPGGPQLRYQAPPPERVPEEMERFIDWFNGSGDMNGIVRAAAAHYHFECIHPFADGNGRIGRAIIDIAISQALGRRTPIAMSTAIAARRPEYYRQLGISQRGGMNLDRWMRWFADTARHAQTAELDVGNGSRS